MHVVFRESHGLEETDAPFDVGQDPADLVVLSYSDSDLGAFAAGWRRANGSLPSLRLANIVALRHPVSVDTYIEKTLVGAKAVIVRLIGGEAYWSYGLQSLHRLAQDQRVALAVLPADGRADAQLDALSTLPVSTLRRLGALCDAGGAVAAQAALAQLALSAGLYAGPVQGDKAVPDFGFYDPDVGIVSEDRLLGTSASLALISFYRSYLTAADTAPIDALIGAFRQRGLAAYGFFAPTLKSPEAAAALRAAISNHQPDVIVNATAFSVRDDAGRTPFDTAIAPVFQVQISTARRREWAEAERGLSPADLAMHVVLPEVDGRLTAGVVSFKSPEKRDPDLQFSRFAHRADGERVSVAVDRMLAWRRLAVAPTRDCKVAIVLSTYPGRTYQMAHAVGLDTVASTHALIDDLSADGLAIAQPETPLEKLPQTTLPWPVSAYREELTKLPRALQDDLTAAWGALEDDPAYTDYCFHFHAVTAGNGFVALQPERGDVALRDDDYHDVSRVPRHGYVAFYLWLKSMGLHALVHMGAHGTLEWLPGKAAALSNSCWPETLMGPTPVIYPFIVNDPGEAAQAKRRIGAVTIGHRPPPLTQATTPETLVRLEQLLDEYANADGLDPARRTRLIERVRDEARGAGVEDDLGLAPDACAAEAITRIDRFVCDLKDSQLADGLRVLSRGDGGDEERNGLLTALAGRQVAAGPAGSPYRGRSDVLPTGRNLFAVDPRAVPT
ncbi:MAG: cobaltochelatase subunit CobN, partial [Pseudomonadota bacterium]